MRVDALPDFDRHGSKLISTDLRALPRAELGRIGSCFLLRVWLSSKSDLLLSAFPVQHRGSSPWALFSPSAVSCRPGSHDGSLAITPNAARWRRGPLEIGGEMGQVWIAAPFADEKCSYLQHKFWRPWSKLSSLSHSKRSRGWPLGRVGKNHLLDGGP